MNPVVSATNKLENGLTAYQVLIYMSIILAIFNLLTVSFTVASLGGIGGGLSLLLLLEGLFFIAVGAGTYYIVNWIKDWQTRISDWTRGQHLDRGRLEQLANTLSKWILWSQWSPIIIFGLFLLLSLAGGAILGGLTGAFSSGTNNPVGSLVGASGFGAIIAIGFLLIFAPITILNWLVFKSIKTWMLEVTNCALGRPMGVNLLGQTNTVSSWLVFTQVMIVIIVLLSLLPIFTGRGLNTSSLTSIVTTLLTLAGYALNFMLLQWSKTFMFGVAGYAERYGSSEGLSQV